MTEQMPSIGRLVHYRLSAEDVTQIMRRRTTAHSIAGRIGDLTWPVGAQAHIGNDVHEGAVFPMIIVAVWGTAPSSCVNGQVFLDGCDVFWALSRSVGDHPGTWSWPAR